MSLSQIIFIITLILTIGIFLCSAFRLARFFRLTKKYPVKDWGKRLLIVLKIAFGQIKIFRFPFAGFLHAIVFWGFMIILFGSIEMILDGVFGLYKSLSFLGVFYSILMGFVDVFAFLISIAIIIFIIRRIFHAVKRFDGCEMTKKTHADAFFALFLIFTLMVSLLGMNTSEALLKTGTPYPVSNYFASIISSCSSAEICYQIFWWTHIELIFFFANILPYSKHFHIFMSIPNVLLSRIEPLGKLNTMESITKELQLIMNPDTAITSQENTEPKRFGVKDAEDVTWKTYLDSLTCTQCGRCTSVCPAAQTGHKLSPRKLLMDLRARMNEKAPHLVKNKLYNDEKSYLGDYISLEELWACTLCNSCAQECPLNIHHPQIIIDLRRYLVLEEGKAKGGLQAVFANIEKNGAPWQYSPSERLNWINSMTEQTLNVPVMSEVFAQSHKPEYLYWVGCAGAYDFRYKKVARAFARILNFAKIDFAVLGVEETCTGDPARRAGNEMLFQMQAMQNIQLFKQYEVKKILTTCPHCYNTLKNEYPDLGSTCEVIHYTEFIEQLIAKGIIPKNSIKSTEVTYHDPCYLGRANHIYDAPRRIIKNMGLSIKEMKRNKSFALCCGAGGAQFFKESEPGTKEICTLRTEDALETNAKTIVTACPFCITMLTDGLKKLNKEEEITVKDVAEIVVEKLY